MNSIKCLIVDDEPLALDLLEGYIKQTPSLELLARCSNVFEAMHHLDTQTVDLLFLDIQMPDLSGLEFSRTLKNGPRIVFTTAFEEYAIQGFKVDALDYLLKPFSYEEFLATVVKAKDWFQLIQQNKNLQKEEDVIFVKSEYKQVKIVLKDVLYFEGLKDYVKIYLEGQTRPILSLISLKLLEEELPSYFMRIHRSFIVNLNKIEAVERSQVVIHKLSITIADNYKDKFGEYLSSKSLHP
jgi:DNA-binding LytR/AlgR family response regulator